MWPRAAFPVQPLRQCLGRHTGGVVTEDPTNHFGFRRHVFLFTCRRLALVPRASDILAVAEAAYRLPKFHVSRKASARLIGEILQEQGVHCALQADVEVCDVALGERDDVDAGEGETLEETGSVFWSQLNRSRASAITTSNRLTPGRSA